MIALLGLFNVFCFLGHYSSLNSEVVDNVQFCIFSCELHITYDSKCFLCTSVSISNSGPPKRPESFLYIILNKYGLWHFGVKVSIMYHYYMIPLVKRFQQST